MELAALHAKYGALAAKHEEALGKLVQIAAAKEAAEAAREAASSEAHTNQQHARTHAIRCSARIHLPLHSAFLKYAWPHV